MLLLHRAGSDVRTAVPYDGESPMHQYLRDVLAPLYGLECRDGTVFAKVHTPDLRVVFSNECRNRRVKEMIPDWSVLTLSGWPSDDVTVKSLMGNAVP